MRNKYLCISLSALLLTCTGVLGVAGDGSEDSERAAAPLIEKSPRPTEDSEAIIYDVLDHLISLASPDAKSQNSVLLVSSIDRAGVWMLKESEEWLSKLPPEKTIDAQILNAFKEANSKPGFWGPSKATRGVRVVDGTVIRKMIADGGWERVEREFPGARESVSISRPAFSQDHKTALIYYTTGCTGILSGGGMLVLMRKTEDRWIVERLVVGASF
jgi:hypothetical protein